MATTPSEKRVVVVGSGVMGCAVAYFLSLRGVQPVVVESTGVAHAASGKSGGFLAKTWNDSLTIGPLTRASYALHEELAKDLDGESNYQWRRLHTVGVRVQVTTKAAGRAASSPRAPLGGVPFLDGPGLTGKGVDVMGSPEDTAQVHPQLFTATLLRAAEARGASLVMGTVVGVQRDGGAVAGVTLGDGTTLPADVVVFCLGPWSNKVNAWLPEVPAVFDGTLAHSIVLHPTSRGAPVYQHAVFMDARFAGRHHHPEIYPRPDRTVYSCGFSDPAAPVPDDPSEVPVDAAACDKVEAAVFATSASIAAGFRRNASQACFLPTSADDVPVIGAVPGVEGAIMCAAHSCWGILLSPASGKAVADLVVDGATELVDLSPFRVERFV